MPWLYHEGKKIFFKTIFGLFHIRTGTGLDRNTFKNYQTVSRLSFVFRKLWQSKFDQHIAQEGVSNINKSAYRGFH